MSRIRWAASIALAGCLGCASPEDGVPTPAPGTGGTPGSGGASSPGTGGGANSGSGGAGGATDGPRLNPLGRARCTTPEGLSGTPQTIEDAVALLNALPKPTSVPCFVESLDRPLGAYATSSIFSAQPAFSYDSPRVFLKVGRTWISVVLDGPSSDLIEFGYLTDDGLHTQKGELKLPLSDVIPPTMPFDRVLYTFGGTVCSGCHREETFDHMEGTSQIFSSLAFRPDPRTRVPLGHLRDQVQGCDWQATPKQCDMLSALFGGGDVADAEFPADMATFL